MYDVLIVATGSCCLDISHFPTTKRRLRHIYQAGVKKSRPPKILSLPAVEQWVSVSVSDIFLPVSFLKSDFSRNLGGDQRYIPGN